MPEADWKFASLPKAMVFHPTMEEFGDPLKYIGSIRNQAAKTGKLFAGAGGAVQP